MNNPTTPSKPLTIAIIADAIAHGLVDCPECGNDVTDWQGFDYESTAAHVPHCDLCGQECEPEDPDDDRDDVGSDYDTTPATEFDPQDKTQEKSNVVQFPIATDTRFSLLEID